MSDMKLILIAILSIMVSSRGAVFKISDYKKTTKITVKKDDTFSLQIHGNPTTGYSWRIDDKDAYGEGKAIVLLSSDFESDPHPKGMVGVGGLYTFHFKVVKPLKRKYEINLEYKRLWEEPAIRRALIIVNVEIPQ